MIISLKYTHDCEECICLGRHDFTYNNGERKIFDLYFCKNEYDYTLIARYSDYGPDYISGKEFADNMNSPLFEAKIRAIEKGFIKK